MKKVVKPVPLAPRASMPRQNARHVVMLLLYFRLLTIFSLGFVAAPSLI